MRRQTVSVPSVRRVSCCLQVAELQIDTEFCGLSPISDDEEEDDEAAANLATDDEYLPASEHNSTGTPASTEPKAQSNTDAAEAVSNKDSGQCPVCYKSFKSKYYLKVHNRYRVAAFYLLGLLVGKTNH